MLPHLTPSFLLQADGRRFPLATLLRHVLAHLRADCAPCGLAFERLARRLLGRGRGRVAPLAFRLDRLGVIDLRRARPDLDREAEATLAALRALPAAKRLGALRAATRRRVNPLLPGRLVDEARAALRDGPEQALGWLDLAEEACAWLAVAGLAPADLADLRVRLRAERANALRVADELRAADAHFAYLAADPLLPEVADLRLRAHLLSLEASLRQDQRRFGEATRLLGQAERRYRRLGDTEGIGKTLIKRGNAADLQGKSRDAAALYRRAAELLDPTAFPRLHLFAQHGVALALCDGAEPAAAAAILARNRPLYEQHPDAQVQCLLAHLEGRIAWGLGEHTKAEQRLLQARNGYLAQRQGFNAALVTLDLAAFYLERGRPREVKRLAEQMVSIFKAQDVHRELIAALTVFQQAACAETLTTELLGRLRRYLPLARNDPRFRFEDGEHAEGAAAHSQSPAPGAV